MDEEQRRRRQGWNADDPGVFAERSAPGLIPGWVVGFLAILAVAGFTLPGVDLEELADRLDESDSQTPADPAPEPVQPSADGPPPEPAAPPALGGEEDALDIELTVEVWAESGHEGDHSAFCGSQTQALKERQTGRSGGEAILACEAAAPRAARAYGLGQPTVTVTGIRVAGPRATARIAGGPAVELVLQGGTWYVDRVAGGPGAGG